MGGSNSTRRKSLNFQNRYNFSTKQTLPESLNGNMNGSLRSEVVEDGVNVQSFNLDAKRFSTPLTSSPSTSANPISVSTLQDYVKARNQEKLKLICRSSKLTVLHRDSLWPTLCRAYKKTTSEPRFDDVLIEISSDTLPSNDENPRKLPSFVDPNYCRYFRLNHKGQRLLEQLLWTLAVKHNEITSCPLLYPIAALFLHYHDLTQTLTSLTYLLEAPSSGIGGKEGSYLLPQSRTQLERQAYVLLRLTSKFGFLPRRGFFSEQRERLLKDNEMDDCFLDWLKWIFIGLPFEHVIRIVDCFLVEGTKFLYRIGLTLLLLYKNSRPSSSKISPSSASPSSLTLDAMLSFCEQIKLSPDELITTACRLRGISRNKVEKSYKKASNEKFKIRSPCLPYHSKNDSLLASPRKHEMVSLDSIRISDAARMAPKHLKSSILDWYLLDTLWDWLPERILVKEPDIIFCSDVHGNSLSTFFAKNENADQTILLIKTTGGEIFGAFCSASWSDRLGNEKKGSNKQYFGTGETFLFTLKPKVAYYPWVGTKEYGSNQHKNIPVSCQLFMAANTKMITIGAGNGVGLWLDENLTKGKTESCDTFNNKPLCSSGDFTCTVVEVIGFISETTIESDTEEM